MTVEELLQDLEDGRIVFAPPLRDAHFPPGFVDEFFREILQTRRELCGVTEETLITDFSEPDAIAEIFERIRIRYGIDCEGLADLKLVTALRACEDADGEIRFH